MNNPYLPHMAHITDIYQETLAETDIKTFRIRMDGNASMAFKPGQFMELTMPGVGEAPFGFASSPLETDAFDLTIKKAGLVTESVHNLKTGDIVFVRGPFGNTFPTEALHGKDIFFVAGGLGIAPLRPLLLYLLHPKHRQDFGRIRMLLAARSPVDFIYCREYDDWQQVHGVEILQTIDRPTDGWKHQVGFPHLLIQDIPLDMDRTAAVLCGPPIMIKLAGEALMQRGLPKTCIYTTLEMRMTCGIGKCGRCNIGHEYICVDGPVYSLDHLSALPDEY